MNPLPTPQTDPTSPTDAEKPGPPRWQVTIYQLLFGVMAVGFGGLISAEPTLRLERQEDGRVEAWYALEAYGSADTSPDDAPHLTALAGCGGCTIPCR